MRHPSGRPIRRAREVKRGYWNMPGDGPVTPRLRQGALKDAIGFRAPPAETDEWADILGSVWQNGRRIR